MITDEQEFRGRLNEWIRGLLAFPFRIDVPSLFSRFLRLWRLPSHPDLCALEESELGAVTLLSWICQQVRSGSR